MGEADIKKDFFHHVNMSIKELEVWLDDDLSMNTGLAADDGEPKGHKSGKETLALLKKHGEGKKGQDASYSEEEIKHMKNVNAYCKRHLKQGNSKDPEHSKWRYSLMNWACDPLKKPLGDADKVIMPGKQDKGAKSPEKKSEAAKSPEKKTEAAKSPEKAKSPSKASPEKKSEKAASPEKKPSSPTKRKQDESKAENGKEDAKKQKTDA